MTRLFPRLRKIYLAKYKPLKLAMERKQVMAVHPAQYLAKIKVAMTDTRGNIKAIMHMPYPADPLVEPEFQGLTYYQVALIKQAQLATIGELDSLEFFTDRDIGKPAQVQVNVNTQETLDSFLRKIAIAEGEVIDVKSEAEELFG